MPITLLPIDENWWRKALQPLDTPHRLPVSESKTAYHLVMQRRGVGGRPSKGARAQLICRTHPSIGNAVQVHADKAGLTVNDFIAKCLAEYVGLEHLIPASHPVLDIEELPIQKAG
jgi:hypothetical protein